MRALFTGFNALGAVLFGLAFLAYTLAMQPQRVGPAPRYGAEVQGRPVEFTLFFGETAGGLASEKRSLRLGRDTPLSRAQAVVAAVVSGPQGSRAVRVVPAGTPVPEVWLRGDHAFLNLPNAYTRLGYGPTGERAMACAFVRSLLGVPDVRSVTFLVEGKSADALRYLDLRTPFTSDDCAS